VACARRQAIGPRQSAADRDAPSPRCRSELRYRRLCLSRQSLAGPCASIQNFRFWFGLGDTVGLIPTGAGTLVTSPRSDRWQDDHGRVACRHRTMHVVSKLSIPPYRALGEHTGRAHTDHDLADWVDDGRQPRSNPWEADVYPLSQAPSPVTRRTYG
jgi:hypothetical protein